MKTVNISKIHSILKKEVKKYKVPVVDLIKIQTKDAFKVLVATILSARTQDAATSKAAAKLFTKVKNLKQLSKLSISQIQNLIKNVGFYKNKSKFLKQLPIVIKEKFNNKIPTEVEELVKLPGVGRKTANLVSSIAFNKHAICVDTHVHKIMNRLGYVKTISPFKTELALREKLPKKYWKTINTLLVAFGQNICRPLSPYCSKCPIRKYCNRINVKKSR